MLSSSWTARRSILGGWSRQLDMNSVSQPRIFILHLLFTGTSRVLFFIKVVKFNTYTSSRIMQWASLKKTPLCDMFKDFDWLQLPKMFSYTACARDTLLTVQALHIRHTTCFMLHWAGAAKPGFDREHCHKWLSKGNKKILREYIFHLTKII